MLKGHVSAPDNEHAPRSGSGVGATTPCVAAGFVCCAGIAYGEVRWAWDACLGVPPHLNQHVPHTADHTG